MKATEQSHIHPAALSRVVLEMQCAVFSLPS